MADSESAFAAALGEVLSQFGKRVVDRPEQLRGALSDTLGSAVGDHRPTVNAVVAASREGVASQIRDADPTVAASPEQIQAWFDQLLSAGVSLRDAALATKSWAEAFDASGTAQVTSEISEALLGEDSSGSPQGSSTGLTAGASRTAIGLAAADDRTELGDTFALRSVTDQTTSAEESPAADAASAPGMPAAGGGQATPLVGASPDRARPALWWKRWWPTVMSAGVIGFALAIGVPLIVSNLTPTDFEPVDWTARVDGMDVSAGTPLLTQGEATPFVLTEAELAAILPRATGSFFSLDADEFAINQSVTSAGCAQATKLVTDGGALLLRSSAWTSSSPWLSIGSSVRWYPSEEEAVSAFDSLAVDPAACSSVTVAQASDGTSWPGVVSQSPESTLGDMSVLRTRVTAQSSPAWNFTRDCYRRANVVACVNLAGDSTTAIAPDYAARGMVAVLDDRMIGIPLPWEDQ